MQPIHVDEVMPVVKALHADPGCAPHLADWFEDRGWEDHALVLRHGVFFSGQSAVDALAHGKHLGRAGSLYPYEKWVPYHPAVREAVIRECMGRAEPCSSGVDHDRLDYELEYHTRNVRPRLAGVRRTDWHRIRHHHSWDWNCSARYTAVSPDGARAERVHMTLAKVVWEPHCIALCGGWLKLTVSFWVGCDPFDHLPIVTLFDPNLARDPVLCQIPF